MTRLHGEISRSINVWRSQYNGSKPTALYLSGGGALIQYVTEFFTEKLNIKVDYLNVFSAMSIAGRVDKEALLDVAPMFVELAGMGIRSAAELPVDINLLPETIKIQADIQSKKMYFYGSCLTIVVSLLIFYAGVSKMLTFDKNRANAVRSKVEEAQRLSEQINEKNNQVRNLRGEYDRYVNIIKSRTVWVAILNDLQKVVPDTTWFCAIEGINDIEADRRAEKEAAAKAGSAAQSSASQPSGIAGIFGNPPPEPAPEPPPGDGGMGEMQPQAQTREISILKLKGYSLILKQEILGDSFKANLNNLKKQYDDAKKSDEFLFKLGDGDIVVDLVMQEVGANNIAAFVFYVKLNKPIRL